MRVVHVVTAFPRREGDVITPWMVELLRRSRERGLEAEVLAPAYRGSSDGTVEGVPVRRFRYAPAFLERLTHDEPVPDRLRRSPAHALLVPPYLAASVAAGWREGRRRPDVVHVHWPVPHALAGAAARRSSGGRSALVCSFYAVEINWVESRLPWLGPLLRWTMTTADAVTAISSPTARAVRRISGREPRIVPFAAAVAPARGVGGAEEVRPALTGEGPLRLLFVGRLVERKGVEHLVRALARVRERRDAELVVVGEGTREPAIREAVREEGLEGAVRFAGFLPREELSREYAAADIFVLPAVVDRKGDTEGLGVVLLEALRFERPVVASRAGGIPDIVVDGVTGWLVPQGDADALARRLLEVADRPEEARRVAARGRARAEERFGWERVLSDLEDVYREAVGARRRTARRGARGGGGAGGAGADPDGEEGRDYYLQRLASEAYRRERPAKARVIARICGRELREADGLADLGSGTGLVKKELEVIVDKPIVGFEIDMSFIGEPERVAVADVLRLPVADGSLGFAVANHLYEHVRSQPRLFGEMFRALAPGGRAYLAAGNRLAVMEPHYRLPFLSWLPRRLADAYVRLAGRGEGYRGIRFRTRRTLVAALREAGFEVEDRTERALDELVGETWGPGWERLWRAVRRLPGGFRRFLLRWLSPQWFLLLRKPEPGAGAETRAGGRRRRARA